MKEYREKEYSGLVLFLFLILHLASAGLAGEPLSDTQVVSQDLKEENANSRSDNEFRILISILKVEKYFGNIWRTDDDSHSLSVVEAKGGKGGGGRGGGGGRSSGRGWRGGGYSGSGSVHGAEDDKKKTSPVWIIYVVILICFTLLLLYIYTRVCKCFDDID